MWNKIGSFLVCLVVMIVVAPSVVFANDIQIEFAQKAGIPLAKSSVTVERAIGEIEEGGYRITGMLNVPHRLPMSGHLHVFAFDENGVKTSDSTHRVFGLLSKRKGAKRIPFNVLASGLTDSTVRILVEHHSAGHKES